ncbi:MAG: clan AA aspartic protease [Flavobacteriaceae bacterium]|nr:clan AA aspartic protease [Flavobacteriaceae bacterium]
MVESLQEFLLKNNYSKAKLHLTKTNHFEIIVKVNGKKGRFILDTGASYSIVNVERATQFDVVIEDDEVKLAGAGGIHMDAKISKQNTIGIGQWTQKKMRLVVFNMTQLNAALISQDTNPVDGIIGADVLKKSKAIIDYHKKYLYLKR